MTADLGGGTCPTPRRASGPLAGDPLVAAARARAAGLGPRFRGREAYLAQLAPLAGVQLRRAAPTAAGSPTVRPGPGAVQRLG